MELRCENCNNVVIRNPGDLNKSKSGAVFCTRSCAAIYNNSKTIKRKRKNRCKHCSQPILSGFTYCLNCYIAKHHLSGKTLEEAIKTRKDSNRYTGIRGNARRIFMQSDKPKCCAVCGYDKHFEICHIRDISKFPMDTLISEINALNNLIGLCPNHHWELDHGFLTVGPAGFEPAYHPL